ncbi:hypothetical protein J6590_088816 [Homalodisca vitripennis]|nr:hypothetical protein J6590_088816 [Homalodisca vitripennis]
MLQQLMTSVRRASLRMRAKFQVDMSVQSRNRHRTEYRQSNVQEDRQNLLQPSSCRLHVFQTINNILDPAKVEKKTIEQLQNDKIKITQRFEIFNPISSGK